MMDFWFWLNYVCFDCILPSQFLFLILSFHSCSRSKPSLAAFVGCMMPMMLGVCFLCPSMDCLWHKYHYCPSCNEKVKILFFLWTWFSYNQKRKGETENEHVLFLWFSRLLILRNQIHVSWWILHNGHNRALLCLHDLTCPLFAL